MQDYHVIFVHSTRAETSVYDLDSRLGFPCEFGRYVESTFRDDRQLRPCFRRWFRVVPAELYLSEFASDRHHMMKDGQWLKPPPDYAPIKTDRSSHNLDLFISMKPHDQVPGDIRNFDQFVTSFTRKDAV